MGKHDDKKPLKELAKPDVNPTMLGDPVSLKAETEPSHPTEQDRGAQPAAPNKVTYGKPTQSQAQANVDSESKPSANDQTPTGIGNSKVVGGATPPSTLNTPPKGEEDKENKGKRGGEAKSGRKPNEMGDQTNLKSETVDEESPKGNQKSSKL